MPSELQRVAQQLLTTLDECPRVEGYLMEQVRKYREQAGWIGQTANPNGRIAALQLEAAAQACEKAAHHLARVPPSARAWTEQMVSGIRTAGPAGDDRTQRPDAPGGRRSPTERRHNDDQAEPRAGKSGKAAGADDPTTPKGEQTPRARVTDEEGRRLLDKLPKRENSPLSRPKTRGVWKDADGKERPLSSGRLGEDGRSTAPYYEKVIDFMREHRIGRQDADPMVASHVEAKFALFMREHGLKHETIVVNKIPCDGDFGCDTLLDRFLPPGSTLTVFGPAGFKRTYPKPK